jgi:hypothetical protein
MQIVETPTALPGQCKFCGPSDRKLYLDTGMSEEFYGAWFICNECVNYIADLFGYIHPERARSIQSESARILTENIALIETVNSLRLALQEVTSTLSPTEELNASSVDFSLSDVDSTPVNPAESDVVPAGNLQSPEQQLDSGEGEIDESSNDEGMADLRSIASKPGFGFFDNL